MTADPKSCEMLFIPANPKAPIYEPQSRTTFATKPADRPHAVTLKQILASPNVASKEWVIRQYDHEVQGGSVIKPLVGAANDGPGDAAVVRPKFHSWRGLAVALWHESAIWRLGSVSHGCQRN